MATSTTSVASASIFNSSTIYSGGDVVLMVPVEETTITLVVLLVAAVVEFVVDTVGNATNKYVRVMFNAVVQQVMIVGLLILALLFTQTVYNWPTRWVFVFKWSMMCLFVMIALFTLEIILFSWIAKRSATVWELFETREMDTQGVTLTGWQRLYKQSSYRFLDALKAHGYHSSNGVRFSDYLSKMMRRNIFGMTNVKWVCWVGLATVAVLNGLRVEAFMKLSLINVENVDEPLSDARRFINYFSFVVLIGYVSFGLFVGLVLLMTRRLDNFLGGTRSAHGSSAPAASATEVTVTLDTLDDSRAYLFRHSLDATIELVQLAQLVSQWYMSTFALSVAYQCIALMSLPWGIPVVVLGIVPFVAPLFLFPRLLMAVTILGCLGTNLDEFAVQALIKAAKIPETEWPQKMLRRIQAGREVRYKRQQERLKSRDDAMNVESDAASPAGAPP